MDPFEIAASAFARKLATALSGTMSTTDDDPASVKEAAPRWMKALRSGEIGDADVQRLLGPEGARTHWVSPKRLAAQVRNEPIGYPTADLPPHLTGPSTPMEVLGQHLPPRGYHRYTAPHPDEAPLTPEQTAALLHPNAPVFGGTLHLDYPEVMEQNPAFLLEALMNPDLARELNEAKNPIPTVRKGLRELPYHLADIEKLPDGKRKIRLRTEQAREDRINPPGGSLSGYGAFEDRHTPAPPVAPPPVQAEGAVAATRTSLPLGRLAALGAAGTTAAGVAAYRHHQKQKAEEQAPLTKAAVIDPAHLQRTIDKLEKLEQDPPEPKQLQRYAMLGAGVAPLTSIIGDVAEGESPFRYHPDSTRVNWGKTARRLAGKSIAGAITSGMIPVLRHKIDRAAELSDLKEQLSAAQSAAVKTAAARWMKAVRSGEIGKAEVSRLLGDRMDRLHKPFSPERVVATLRDQPIVPPKVHLPEHLTDPTLTAEQLAPHLPKPDYRLSNSPTPTEQPRTPDQTAALLHPIAPMFEKKMHIAFPEVVEQNPSYPLQSIIDPSIAELTQKSKKAPIGDIRRGLLEDGRGYLKESILGKKGLIKLRTSHERVDRLTDELHGTGLQALEAKHFPAVNHTPPPAANATPDATSKAGVPYGLLAGAAVPVALAGSAALYDRRRRQAEEAPLTKAATALIPNGQGSPKSRLASARKVGLPRITNLEGPSLAQVSRTMGSILPGAAKGTI